MHSSRIHWRSYQSYSRVPFAAEKLAAMAVTLALLSTFIPSALVPSALAQENTPSEKSVPEITVSKLSPPLYPPLGRQAAITGDVKVQLFIRADGTVESATSLSGDPMLVPAALDSAKRSEFQCRGCSSETTSFVMTYTFQILGKVDRCCCTQGASRDPVAERFSGPQVSQMQDHITITAAPGCICPDECTVDWARRYSRSRSARCLYLWKCRVHSISIE